MSGGVETEGPGIGARLRAARERHGWSREALAFHSGISWSAIAQVESGRRTKLRPDTLSALSKALGVTIDYLVLGGHPGGAMLQHRALLYDTDQQLLDTVVPFLAEGVERSEPTFVVMTNAKIELIREQMGSDADSVDFAESKKLLTTPGAAINAFQRFVDEKLDAGAPWVRIVGEPIWSGRSKSEVRLWIRFESTLNLVFAASPMTVICPYDMRTISPEVARQATVTHPHTIGKGEISPSPEYADPAGFILEP